MQATLQAAAMTALKTQALTCLIRSGGDPVDTLKSFTSAQTLQNVVVSVAAAGLIQGLNNSLDLNLKLTPEQLKGAGLGDYMQTAAFKGAIHTTLNGGAAAMRGQDVKATIKTGVIMAAINGVAQYTAGRIGELYYPTPVQVAPPASASGSHLSAHAAPPVPPTSIDYVTHKALHGLLGATSGMGS